MDSGHCGNASSVSFLVICHFWPRSKPRAHSASLSQLGDQNQNSFLPIIRPVRPNSRDDFVDPNSLTRRKRFWRFIGWPQDIMETLPRSNPLKFQCFCGSFWENNIIHLETLVFLILFGRLRNPRRTPSVSLLPVFVRSGQIHGTTLAIRRKALLFYRIIGYV